MRDICVVIDFLNKNVIPEDQFTLKRELKNIAYQAMYTPPECQQECWIRLAKVISGMLGSPIKGHWTERLSNIILDKEKITYERF